MSVTSEYIETLQDEIQVLRADKADLESRLQQATEDYASAARMAQIVYDLDRCAHGRHRQDMCSAEPGCGGPSAGNPTLPPGAVIGYDIGGRPYTMPDGYLATGNPDNWSTK